MTTPNAVPPRPAAVYIRTSTAEQAERFGPDAQRAACLHYAAQNGLEVVRVYQDEVSGTQEFRPALQKLYADAHKFQVVIVYHQDRLARDTVLSYSLLTTFAALGLELHSTTTGKLKRDLIFGLQSMLAEDERRRILERTDSGREQKAKKGLLPSKLDAFGYKYTKGIGSVELVPQAAEIVRRIFEEAAEGKSWRNIALSLNREGVQAPRGSRNSSWSPNTVAYIVRNPVYRGEFVYRRVRSKSTREPISIPVQPIVSPEVWALAQRPKRSQTSRKGLFALTGHLFCGQCGGTMSGKITNNGWKDYRKYKCNKTGKVGLPHTCTSKEVPAPALEEEVWKAIRKEVRTLEPPLEPPNNEIKAELAALDAESKRLLEAFTKKAISVDELRQLRDDLDRQRARLQKSKVLPQESIGVERLKQIAEGLPLAKLVRLTQARIIFHPSQKLHVELFGGRP